MSALFPAAPDAFGADELLRLRRETPAWGSYAHFAHGSASLPPQVLYDALDSWLEAERRWGVQRAAEHFAEPLLAVRDSVARVLGTQPRHIALLDCASRAWSVAFAAPWPPIHGYGRSAASTNTVPTACACSPRASSAGWSCA